MKVVKQVMIVNRKKCIFKDNIKLKQAIEEIEKYLDAQQKYFDGEDYHNLLDIINKTKKKGAINEFVWSIYNFNGIYFYGSTCYIGNNKGILKQLKEEINEKS